MDSYLYVFSVIDKNRILYHLTTENPVAAIGTLEIKYMMSENQAKGVIASCSKMAEKVLFGADTYFAIDKNAILGVIMNQSKMLNVEMYHETLDALNGNLDAYLDKHGILRSGPSYKMSGDGLQRSTETLRDQVKSSLTDGRNAGVVIEGVSVVISARNDVNRYIADYGYRSISYSPIRNPDIDFVFLKIGSRLVDVNLYAAYVPIQKYYVTGTRNVKSYINAFDKPLGNIICCSNTVIGTAGDYEFHKAYRSGVPKRFLIVEAYYVIKYNEHKSVDPECLVPPEWMITSE